QARMARSSSSSMDELLSVTGSRARPSIPLDRPAQPFLDRQRGLPVEQAAGSGDVGLAHLGVVDGQRPVDDLALRPADLENETGELEQGELARVAEVDRVVH